jgi:hypothetical protein
MRSLTSPLQEPSHFESAKMDADKSRYLHSSIYQFDEGTSTAICKELQDVLPDARVHCEYDASLNLFYIVSPSELGSKADEHLTAIIRTHIKRAAIDYENCLVEVGRQSLLVAPE